MTVLGNCCELNYLLAKYSVRVNVAHWICCNNWWNSRKNVFSVCSPLASFQCCLCLRWSYDQAKSSFALTFFYPDLFNLYFVFLLKAVYIASLPCPVLHLGRSSDSRNTFVLIWTKIFDALKKDLTSQKCSSTTNLNQAAAAVVFSIFFLNWTFFSYLKRNRNLH